MTLLFQATLIGIVAWFLLIAFQNKQMISILFTGTLAITIMSIIGIESGKTAVSLGVVMLGFLIFIISQRKIQIRKINIIALVIFCLFSMFVIFSVTYSPAMGQEYGLWKLRQFLILIFIPALLMLLGFKMKSGELRRIEWLIILTTLITAVFLLFNFLTGNNSLEASWFERQSLGESNPIWLSRFLSLGILVLQAPRFQSRPLLVYGASGFMLIAALLTGSKTVLFFTIPIVILYKIVNGSLRKKLAMNLVLISGVVIAVVAFLSTINAQALIRRFSLESNTIDLRASMYQESFNSFLKSSDIHHLVGNGLGTIGNSLGYFYVRVYPHNLFLELLFEFGILGFGLFLAQVVFACMLYLSGIKNWVFFAYIMHVLFSLTSGDLVSNSLMFIFFALYIVSHSDLRRAERDKTEEAKPISKVS